MWNAIVIRKVNGEWSAVILERGLGGESHRNEIVEGLHWLDRSGIIVAAHLELMTFDGV